MSTPAPQADSQPAARHNVSSLEALEKPDGPLLRLIKDRRIAFLAVGATNTLNGLIAFYLFHRLFGDRLYLVTLLCSHVVTVLIAFVLYRRLVFRVRGNVAQDLWRFETVYLVGLGLNALLLMLGVDVLHAPVMACQVVITLVQAVWSWLGHGHISFRRTKAHS